MGVKIVCFILCCCVTLNMISAFLSELHGNMRDCVRDGGYCIDTSIPVSPPRPKIRPRVKVRIKSRTWPGRRRVGRTGGGHRRRVKRQAMTTGWTGQPAHDPYYSDPFGSFFDGFFGTSGVWGGSPGGWGVSQGGWGGSPGGWGSSAGGWGGSPGGWGGSPGGWGGSLGGWNQRPRNRPRAPVGGAVVGGDPLEPGDPGLRRRRGQSVFAYLNQQCVKIEMTFGCSEGYCCYPPP